MYCRNCGKELLEDSRFCPYCGKEVNVEPRMPKEPETEPVQRHTEEKASALKKYMAGLGVKKLSLGAGIVLGLVIVGVGVSALANNANGNKIFGIGKPKATATPHPTKAPTINDVQMILSKEQVELGKEPEQENTEIAEPTATPEPTAIATPKPTKVPTLDDVELTVSASKVEVGKIPQVVHVQIIENGYDTTQPLAWEVEDEAIVTCEWGNWEGNKTIAITIYASEIGETTVKVYLDDTDIYKEIKVVSTYEATIEDVEVIVTPDTVHVGESSQTVIVSTNRNGYQGKLSFSYYADDITIADAMWDKNTAENDLLIYGKKKGETSFYVYVLGVKDVEAEIKVTSDGATVLATATPKPTATPKATATPKPTVTPKPKATSTPKPTATPKPAATATPKPTASPKSDYTVKDSSGKYEMSVKPGFASTVTKETKYAATAEQAKLLLPDLEAWSEGKFIRSEVAEHDTYTALYYHAPTMSKEDSLAMLEEYYKLLEGYGVYKNITQTSSLYSYYYEWQDMDYTGNVSITENAATSYDELPCDLSGWYSYEGFGDIAYGIEYPEEIGLTDTGERYGGKAVKITKTEILENTSMPEYTVTESGLDCFKITGWGWEETDYVEICLHPDLYEKGDVFNLKDFAAQADAGSGKLNSFTVRSMRIGREDWLYKNVILPNKEKIHMYSSIRVEIVEKSETVTVIQYVAKIRNVYGDDYVLEGLFAVKTGEEVSAGSSASERESVSIGIGEVRCTSCRGTGVRENNCIRCRSKGEIDCSYCSGDGEVDCTKCGGDGRIWDALNGEDAQCSSCYGSGDKRCTKCSGTGDVNCTSCGGKGYTESQCSICLGRGKY